MIRTFYKAVTTATYNEIRRINTETNVISLFVQDKELGFAFSDYETTLANMGYRSMNDFIKTLEKHGFSETDTKAQIQSEINGLLNLAKYRKDNGHHVSDIPGRLEAYGIHADEARRMVLDIIK
jgi:hypothetical protein